MLPGVLQSRCARHDGGVQGREGNSLTDEVKDSSDFDVDLIGMNLNVTKYQLYRFKGDKNHNLASSCRAWMSRPSSIS